MMQLKKCPNCQTYSLGKDKCPKCESSTNSAHPAKFSIEDKYAKYRRAILLEKLKG